MKGFGRNSLTAFSLAVAMLVMLLSGLGSWALAQVVEDQSPFSDLQVRAAHQEALKYVSVEYEFQGETAKGMPYLLGGQTSVSDVSEVLAEGKIPGEGFGIDASGLVINSYRSVDPQARFVVVSGNVPTYVADVSSSAMFKWNIEEKPLESLVPGDLLFFYDSSGSGIGGVAIFSGYESGRVKFVTASAKYGRVIETWLRTDGDYWKTRFAGAGRLLYVK